VATQHEWLRELVHDVADFPKPGVGFKDITPLLGNSDALRFSVEAMADPFIGTEIDAVVGVDARGFILGAPVAYRLGCGFVPVRKGGKLPRDVLGCEYELEYGTERLEIKTGGVTAGQRVVVVDDVLATGGTAAAACDLVQQCGAEISGLVFLLELASLGGRNRLLDPPSDLASGHGTLVEALLTYA